MMNASIDQWFTDMATDDSFYHQCDMITVDQFTAQQMAVAYQESFSSESYSTYQTPVERPKKLVKTSSWGTCNTEQKPAAVPDASSPSMLSFNTFESVKDISNLYGNFAGSMKPKKEVEDLVQLGNKRNYECVDVKGSRDVPINGRSISSKEHIMAERKRREKLSQRFIALSAIVPGLKKMDKASVLADAINYLKQLEEKVKNLEDQAAKKPVESAVLVKKSQLLAEDDGSSSSDENFDGHKRGEPPAEIEAKIADKTLLVKIHCNNNKGVLVKVLSEIEKLHLSISNTSVIPFAGSSIDITVTAQMDDDFSMTVKDLVKELNSSLRQ